MSRERPSGLTRVLRPFRRVVRGRLRLRALFAVVVVTLAVLVAFDFAAVTALRGYLMNQTDSALRTAGSLVQPELNELPAGAETPTIAPGGNELIENKPDSDVERGLARWVSTHQFIVGLYGVTFFPDTGIGLAQEDGAI